MADPLTPRAGGLNATLSWSSDFSGSSTSSFHHVVNPHPSPATPSRVDVSTTPHAIHIQPALRPSGTENVAPAVPIAHGSVSSLGKRYCPVELEGPTAKRHCPGGIVKLTDAEVISKGYTDTEIIAASLKSWHSPVYDHYNVGLERQSGGSMIFVFKCRHGCKSHPDSHRARMKTGDGTTQLRKGAHKCDAARGVSAPSPPAVEYSEARHRTLIAMRCSVHHRPFHSVEDRLYLDEVQLLRPGTRTPSAHTVSRDTVRLYEGFSIQFKAYLAEHVKSCYLILDGWSSPFGTSELGVVIQWHAGGRIHRCTLEFIKLSSNHTGDYMAERIFDLLKRYDLLLKILFLMMDNASNCNTTALSLKWRLPRFLGALWRLRCLLHIISLIAKAVESFFNKTYKRKPKSGSVESAEQLYVLENGEELTEEEQDVAQQVEADVAEEEVGVPKAQLAQDKAAVKSVKDLAIADMERRGVFLTDTEQKMALGIMPKVAGLARRLNDSPSSLKPSWLDSLTSKGGDLPHNKETLSRRVATRWNSTCDCLNDHLLLKPVVMDFTDKTELKLKAYRLTPDQWDLAQQLHELLKVFIPVTEQFSKKETPLVADALTALDRLRRSLSRCRDHPAPPPIIRAAANAGVMMADKYFALMNECEVYRIAIALSPHYKLQWFRDHGWTEAQVTEVWNLLIQRWEDYKPTAISHAASVMTHAGMPTNGPGGCWYESDFIAPIPHQAGRDVDILYTYMSEPVVPVAAVNNYPGGVIGYWHARACECPELARFALDYTAAPATSVDAERIFSEGRRQVNFMQHRTTHDAFQASMALGSWYTAPFFDLDDGVDVIRGAMARGDH